VVLIPDELASLIAGGAATWMATRDTAHACELTRVMGARVGDDRTTMTIYVPAEQAGRTFANLRSCAEIAVFFCRVTDYRAVQVKGEVVGSRRARGAALDDQAHYLAAFSDAMAAVGIPRALAERFTCAPCTALEVRVRELFVQTPGPDAGARWR
jgi:hypothetical protein